MKRLIVKAPFSATSGYFSILQPTIEILSQRYDVQLENIGENIINPNFGDSVISRVNAHKFDRTLKPLELLISPIKINATQYDDLAYTRYDNRIFSTMWETTKITPFFRNILNSCKAVIVPCSWNAKNFADDGVENIEVLPLFIDTKLFSYEPRNSGLFVFGAACGSDFSILRKNVNKLPVLFNKAFPSQKDVKLSIKLGEGQKSRFLDQRLSVIVGRMDNLALSRWYKNLNIFITLSNSEGWGLMQHEAMGCGAPLLGPIYSGLEDFANSDNSFNVPYNLVAAEGYYAFSQGLWSKYDEEGIIEGMRYCYQNQDKVAQKSIEASKSASSFSLERYQKDLLSIIEKYI